MDADLLYQIDKKVDLATERIRELADATREQGTALKEHAQADHEAFKEFGERVGSVEKEIFGVKTVLKFWLAIPAMIVAGVHVLKFFGWGH